MKNTLLITALTAGVVIIFTSCLVKNVIPTAPVPDATPTQCAEISLNGRLINYSSTLPLGDYVITTEADYLANYGYTFITPDPVPSPEAVDFGTKLVVGVFMPGICSGSSRTIEGMTTDCQSSIISIRNVLSLCPGMSQCMAYDPGGVVWYEIDRTGLPVVGNYTNVNMCNNTTITARSVYPLFVKP